jgi:hypothetical protein
MVCRAILVILEATEYVPIDAEFDARGHNNPEILNSMLIVSGASVHPGRLPPPVEIVDAVATAAAHLGVTIDDQWGWDGKPQGLTQP